MSLPEHTTLAEILLYLSVLREEADEEEPSVEDSVASLAITSDGMCCVTDKFHGDRYLTITQLLIDMRHTID